MLTPRVETLIAGTCHGIADAEQASTDREMRCGDCGTRAFTSRAPELVDASFGCPRCGSELALVPATG